jgi:hypothetical protein
MKGKLPAFLLIPISFFALPIAYGQKEISADKITRGRTADEKIYEYVVPANEWVVTSLLITSSREVMIHHFASSERVTVKLGALNDSRLQRPGTILPLYTSGNCSTDRGPSARVTYSCVQLSKPEGVKMFARNSVRVGIAVKNR